MTVSFGITGGLITNGIPGTQGQRNDGVNPAFSSLMTETASSARDALTIRIDFGSNTAAPDIATEFFNERNRIGLWGIGYVKKMGITFTQDDFEELFDFLVAIWDESTKPLSMNGRSQHILDKDRIKVGKRIGFIKEEVDDETAYLLNLGEILTNQGLTYFTALETYLRVK